MLHGRKAVGVECVRDGRIVTFGTHREVVLSAGGFNTPKILMLSGIGDRKELRDLNIPVHQHSPEVGKKVQDHSTIMPRIVAVPTMPACVLIGLRMAEILVEDGHHGREGAPLTTPPPDRAEALPRTEP